MKWSPHTHTNKHTHAGPKKPTQTQQQCRWVDVRTCTHTWICVNTPSFARVYNLCCSPNETPQWVRLDLMRAIEAQLQKLGDAIVCVWHWGNECWEISWSLKPLMPLSADVLMHFTWSSYSWKETRTCAEEVLMITLPLRSVLQCCRHVFITLIICMREESQTF